MFTPPITPPDPATEIEKAFDSTEPEVVLALVREAYERLKRALGTVIVGQHEAIETVFVAIFARGHVLLEGVPGLGKTLMFRSLAKLMGLEFRQIQFTPDLMPSDIIGTEIIQTDPRTSERALKFMKGPVFANFVLADEINRTSPKTQAALLQAMQDRQVSVGHHTYALPDPFFVLATQNPIEQEGVYPLPEAQLDRFMFNVCIDYPTDEEEMEIVSRFTQNEAPEVSGVLIRADLVPIQNLVRSLLVSRAVVRYIVSLVAATRPKSGAASEFVKRYVECGASPRASIALTLAAKARALLKGRTCATTEDVRAMAPAILRHRMLMNFSAEADGVRSIDLISKVLETVPVPKAK